MRFFKRKPKCPKCKKNTFIKKIDNYKIEGHEKTQIYRCLVCSIDYWEQIDATEIVLICNDCDHKEKVKTKVKD